MPSLALCNAICRRLLSSLESGGRAFSRRQLRWHRSRSRPRPRTRERDWACSIGSFGDCPNPAFRSQGREYYELLWRLSAVLSDEDDSQDLEWTGSSRKE